MAGIDLTESLRWEESCCSKSPSASLPGCWCARPGRHTHHPWSWESPCGRLAVPVPQPAPASLPPSLPPLAGGEAKLPAASKAYCSVVTRNGCRGPDPGRAGDRKGEGRAELGKCLQGGLAAWRSWSTNTPSRLFHTCLPGMSSLEDVRVTVFFVLVLLRQAASRKGFMVTCLPAER